MSRIRLIVTIAAALCPAGLALAQIEEQAQANAFLAQKAAAKAAENAEYQKGESAIDAHQWAEAVKAFNAAAAQMKAHADGALYWKAYALSKMGQLDQTRAALDQLRKAYANSRWLDDAEALEMEVMQASGQKVNPDAQPDEDLKLMALNGLMNSDPNRAIPMIEKFLQGNQPPKLKDRALFVLAQSDTPKAHEILGRIARNGGDPALQMKAIHYLGIMGSQENGKLLSDVYAGSNDVEVKRAILKSFMISGNRDRLLQAAKSEKSADLRKEAIHQLGISGGQAELWQLYQSEPSAEVKETILHSMFIGGDSGKLIEVARTERDARLRKAAIHSLGLMGGEHTGAALVSMYSAESDAGIRGEIIQALFIQGNAKALVDLARKESNPAMKRAIVEKLSIMGSKEGADYMMELLNK